MTDPLSIAAGAAGFLGLSIQIAQLLTGYVNGVKDAPHEAGDLLTEVTALSEVLQAFTLFLRSEKLKGRQFDEKSVLALSISLGETRLKILHIQLDTLRDSYSSKKITDKLSRLKWPLKKNEHKQTVDDLHRLTQIFHFSLTLSNWYVIVYRPHID
jgi:hypothetical protein